jgi:hypothetical protein
VVDIEDDDDAPARPGAPAPPPSPASDLPRTPRPLRSDDFMGDVVVQKARQGRAYKFVFKRKIMIRNNEEDSEDEMFNRLMYLQAADEVIVGNIPVADEERVIELTHLALAIDLGEEFPDNADELLDAEMMEYVPVGWREKYGDEEWAAKILKAQANASMDDPDQMQLKYVERVQDHELYGSHFFHVKKANDPEAVGQLPELMVAMFNSDGLHFLNEERQILMSYGFADIYRWGGSSVQFSLIIWNADTQDTFELILSTFQAADMAGLILDFINAIMAAQQ